jgi:hypothetical protein
MMASQPGRKFRQIAITDSTQNVAPMVIVDRREMEACPIGV